MSDKNIIEFPIDRVKKSEHKDELPIATRLQQSNRMVPVTVLAIFLLFGFVNTMVNSSVKNEIEKNDKMGRNPASQPIRNVKWEHKMANKLAAKSDSRDLASIARTPDARDELVVSLIHSKYTVRFDKGKITDFEFPQQFVDRDVPETIDRYKFLSDYKTLLSVDYKDFKQVSKKEVGSEQIEIFELYKKPSHTLAQVEFKLDRFGRLISMKVVPKNHN